MPAYSFTETKKGLHKIGREKWKIKKSNNFVWKDVHFNIPIENDLNFWKSVKKVSKFEKKSRSIQAVTKVLYRPPKDEKGYRF